MTDLYIYTEDGSKIPNPELTQEEFIAGRNAECIAYNTNTLWQAAHDYEYAQISGSAVGYLAVGVMLGKPKSIAIKGWILSIWTLYYNRKPLVTPDLDLSLLDFSSCGNIPYSVPEFMAELD